MAGIIWSPHVCMMCMIVKGSWILHGRQHWAQQCSKGLLAAIGYMVKLCSFVHGTVMWFGWVERSFWGRIYKISVPIVQ